MSNPVRRSTRQRKIIEYNESSSEGDNKKKQNSKPVQKPKLIKKVEDENFEEPKTSDKSMEDEEDEPQSSDPPEPEVLNPAPTQKFQRTVLTVKAITSKLTTWGGPKTDLSKSAIKGIKIKQKDKKVQNSLKSSKITNLIKPTKTPTAPSKTITEAPEPSSPPIEKLELPIISIPKDPIFTKFTYDANLQKYTPTSKPSLPDLRRIKFLTKIKLKLESTKDRSPSGTPITDIVTSSLLSSLPQRPVLSSIPIPTLPPPPPSSEPLVHSSDARRTNNRKLALKNLITSQKSKYAAQIGYTPSAPTTTPIPSPPAFLTTALTDTPFAQMIYNVDSKLSVLALQSLKSLKKRIIIFINNTLRLHDNPLLSKALEIQATIGPWEILPLFIFDSRVFTKETRGIQKTRFVIESVKELKEKLKELDSDLAVFKGKTEEIMEMVMREDRENYVVMGYEIAPKEKKMEEEVMKVAERKITKVWRVWGATAVHIEDLPYELEKFPHLFGKFKKDVANIGIRKLLEPPKKGEMEFPESVIEDWEDNDYVPKLEEFEYGEEEWEYLKRYDKREGKDHFLFKGGEDYGNQVLKEYIWDKDVVSKYHYAHVSFYINGDFAPKFTPWTSVGALSPRKVFLEILKYEEVKGNSEQSEWFKREMLWKDFFIFWALKHHKVYFTAEYGIYNRSHYDWQTNDEIISKVKEGKTGMPIVDAIIRELNESGYICYKAKMIFANYFCQDLRQDWRRGVELFESKLIDYEPWEVVGKWHQGAGIGPGRIVKYNWLCQSQDHDPKGEYIRRWVTELTKVPEEYIHDPWRMPVYLQKECNAIIGVDYPKPISCLRYTHENKTAHVDRTKALSKREALILENGQASMFSFVKVKDNKSKDSYDKEFLESDKENDASMEPADESEVY